MPLNSTKRIILDTNILLDIFVFKDPGIETLLEAIHSKQYLAVTCEAILNEFDEVIGRSLFALTPEEQEAIRNEARRLHQIETGTTITPAPFTCSDPDDQIFLDLAFTLKPSTLLSKDKAVLKLKFKAKSHGILIGKSLESV
jgi:putative PIN family toxin of toxin-antitoxin system